jgi:hypothetical protein
VVRDIDELKLADRHRGGALAAREVDPQVDRKALRITRTSRGGRAEDRHAESCGDGRSQSEAFTESLPRCSRSLHRAKATLLAGGGPQRGEQRWAAPVPLAGGRASVG